MLYFLLVNYHSSSLVSRLINSISLNTIQPHQLIIINNSPPDQEPLEKLQTNTVKLMEVGENLGFGRACNLGLNWVYDGNPQAIVWLINPDVILSDQIFSEVLSIFQIHPELSILGTVIHSTDQKVWFSGGSFYQGTGSIISEHSLVSDSHQKIYIPCDWVSGCSMIINLSNFPECPQFDPHYFLYYEDFDFCQRYKQQGHLVAVTNQVSIMHEVSAITNRNLKNKIYHSTYSYLFTLERYTPKMVFYLRLLRLLTYAFILLPVKPAIALGKITGAWHYLRKRLSGVRPFLN